MWRIFGNTKNSLLSVFCNINLASYHTFEKFLPAAPFSHAKLFAFKTFYTQKNG